MSELLFIDSQLLAVNKAAGEPVGGKNPHHNKERDGGLLHYWRRTLNDPALQLIHRIDQPVGGVVLLGRNPETLPFFYEAFASKAVNREYIAVVTTPPDRTEGTLTDIITPGTLKQKTSVVTETVENSAAKTATLRYRVIGSTTHHTVMAVQLLTGRHHQIRAQLAHRGWHILGDARYGARRPMRDRSIGLFAWRITVPHPDSPIPLTITAPMPCTSLWDDIDQVVYRAVAQGMMRFSSEFNTE